MPQCVAFGCNFESRGDDGTDVSIHSFPQEKERRKQWEKACGQTKLPKYARLCSRHFTPESFEAFSRPQLLKELMGDCGYRRRLNRDAVPTLFLRKRPTRREARENRTKRPWQKTPDSSLEEPKQPASTGAPEVVKDDPADTSMEETGAVEASKVSSNTTSSRCYCCVPCCSNNKKKHPYISFHDFPVDSVRRSLWVRAIRRDEGPQFRVQRSSTYVCSLHFAPEDLLISASGRTLIRQGAVPSRFHWNDWGKATKAGESLYHWGKKHCSTVVQVELKDAVSAMEKDHDYTGKRDSDAQNTLEYEVNPLTLPTQQPLIYKFCVTDDDVHHFCKLSSKEVLGIVWESVRPSNYKLFYWTQAHGSALETPSPQFTLPLIDQFFLFLCCIAAGLKEYTLSAMFEVSLSTVSQIIKTWTNYLYQVLGSLPTWKTRKQIQNAMPDKLKLYCPHVRVILDSTEIQCETASSQTLTSSDSIPHTTFKGLIGVSPCGAITFVSKLYTGPVSDFEITIKSKILQLLEPGDGVMAAKGFLTEKMLSEVGAVHITHCKSSQLGIKKTQTIARLRIPAERAIRRVKEYHIWDGPVPLSMKGLVNQLWAVCCLMSNYQDIKI